MYIAAGLAAAGGVVAWLTIRTATPVRSVVHGSVLTACEDACVRVPARSGS